MLFFLLFKIIKNFNMIHLLGCVFENVCREDF